MSLICFIFRGIENEPTDILIPCEYCDTQVSVQDLERHTVEI